MREVDVGGDGGATHFGECKAASKFAVRASKQRMVVL